MVMKSILRFSQHMAEAIHGSLETRNISLGGFGGASGGREIGAPYDLANLLSHLRPAEPLLQSGLQAVKLRAGPLETRALIRGLALGHSRANRKPNGAPEKGFDFGCCGKLGRARGTRATRCDPCQAHERQEPGGD